MPRPSKNSRPDKENKTHYIKEWADKRGLSQAAIARALEVEKSTVSRWFKGTIPVDRHLGPLAELLQTEQSSLFRDPDDDWIARFFRERSREDRERAKELLQMFFDKKVA